MENAMFSGRIRELQELEARYFSRKKEFGVIYGRRRIGKSELVKQFLKSKPSFLFQAKRDNAYGNLKSFSYEFNKLTGQPKHFVYASWEEALDAVLEFAGEDRFVLAIDEYPYIVEQDSSFSSILQEFYDRAGANIFLLIFGSDVSMLKEEIQNHASPLYKRRTMEMAVQQMPYREALAFLTPFDDATKCDYLSLMSTFPYYLAAIDPQKSFEENVTNLLFNPYGAFFTLPDQLLSNSTKVQDVYNAILAAIAHRKRTNKEIADAIHEDEAKVSKYLITLQESELVTKCTTFMGTKKTLYYEIGDPLLRFWYAFIFDNQERIKTNGARVYEELKEEIRQFLCHGFEEVCRLFIDQCNRDGTLPEVFDKPRVYHVEKSVLHRSVELDGVSLTKNTLLVVECKYRESVFTEKMFSHLQESASVFPEKYQREYYLFSKSGFEETLRTDAARHVHCYALQDLFS